jgi:hypothetical protein
VGCDDSRERPSRDVITKVRAGVVKARVLETVRSRHLLNNGIEFAATYFIMLLALFFIGAGRYLSVDFWLARRFAGAPLERSVGASFGGRRAAATPRMS